MRVSENCRADCVDPSVEAEAPSKAELNHTVVALPVKGPFDLRLSLAGAASFLPVDQVPSALITVLETQETPTTIAISQRSNYHPAFPPRPHQASMLLF
jgi:hypothetical protein